MRAFDALSPRLADPRLPALLLAVALAVSGTVLVAMGSSLVFFIDEWDVLLHRRGFNADAFLMAHGEHPAIATAIVYKAIQATFGMDSITPYVVAAIATFLLSAALLFVYLRRRVGAWLALAATVPILFLGTAYEDLLTPFQIGYFGSMACGLGALLALERDDRRGELIACALLVAGLTFSSLGIPFLAGAALVIGFRERGRLDRAYVVAVPILLYGLWYLGWGREAETQVSLENLLTSPGYVLDGFAASVGSLLGVGAPRDEAVVSALEFGRPLLAGLVVLAGARLLALGRIPRWVWVVLAIAVGFWFLAALNASFARAATVSRYQYVGAIFCLLIAAELARGMRPGWRVTLGVFAVAVAATIANLSALNRAYDGYHGTVPVIRGGLAGLEIAAGTVDPEFRLTGENSGFDYFTLVDAGSYLSAVEEFGSPAYQEAELASATESARVAADKALAAALSISLATLAEAQGSLSARCPGTIERARQLELEPGSETILSSGGAGAGVRLRRYATESYPVELGQLRAGRSATLTIPADRSRRPWQLELTGGGTPVLCRLDA